MKRIIFSTAALGLAVCAFALSSMVSVVQQTYKFKPDSDAAKARCLLCHTSKMGGALNPYGKDLKVALKGSKTLTAAVLHSIDGKDSSGSGMTNGEKLKAGKNPGVK